jgi:hypothetical protein
MRFTCSASTAGVFNRPAAATFSSSSSGPVLQRKNESRDARSISVIRYALLAWAAAGSSSIR